MGPDRAQPDRGEATVPYFGHTVFGHTVSPDRGGPARCGWPGGPGATAVAGPDGRAGASQHPHPRLTLYVDGRKVAGDPARLSLAPHQQIAPVYGPSGQNVDVPIGYNFSPGE